MNNDQQDSGRMPVRVIPVIGSGNLITISAGIRCSFNLSRHEWRARVLTMAKGRNRSIFMLRESKAFVKVATHSTNDTVDATHDVTQPLDQYPGTLLAQHDKYDHSTVVPIIPWRRAP